VIKLDRTLVAEPTTVDRASDLGAVLAEAERSGAIILGEGIETEAHERRALAVGATLGQGWRFGRPAEGVTPASKFAWPLAAAMRPTDSSPVHVAFGARLPRIATKRDLLAFSRHLEGWAAASGERPVVLGTFQTDARFTPATRRRYADLASHCAFTAAMGVGVGSEPAVGVRGADLRADDALVGQWNVIVIGRHINGALIARDMGDTSADEGARRFEFVITYDRALVVAAAQTLMARISPIV
jgi:hypothetical protein